MPKKNKDTKQLELPDADRVVCGVTVREMCERFPSLRRLPLISRWKKIARIRARELVIDMFFEQQRSGCDE